LGSKTNSLPTTNNPLLSISDVVNLKYSRHAKRLFPSKAAIDVVGMDIGYGEGVSPGGYQYCLIIIDRKTRKTWVYGLPSMGGNSLCDALWRVFIGTRAGLLTRFKPILTPILSAAKWRISFVLI
jgi:hypothetical protein